MNILRFAFAGAVLVVACSLANNCLAEIMPAPAFTDRAVLQRDQPVPIWGYAEAGEKITVSYRGQSLETVTGADGRWQITLAPMAANANGAEVVIAGKTTVTLHDVVVGEVWIASGQSNMEWPLDQARNGKAEIAAANNPLVRHLRVEHAPSDMPTDSVKTSGWQLASPDTAGGFTAVGYFFAQALAQKLGVPVGIIHSSWGGTPIESWLPESVLRASKAGPRFEAEWTEALKVFPQKQKEYPALDAAWRKADEESRATGKPNPLPWPHPPVGPGTAYAPGGLFNGMILPFAPGAIRGVIWYQGESNVDHANEYRELFPAMIKSWRAAWSQGDFPFYFVQLPNYANNGKPSARDWAAMREAQGAALALPSVAMAVTLDVGEATNLHPPDKRPVGERLALVAEAHTYGLQIESSGPVFQSFQREGAALRVRFSHAYGLNARASRIDSFEIAGADRIFHPATAKLEGENVLVSAPGVTEPVAVRHAYTNSPVISLYNAAGLPAAPFRTDDW